ncbi:MAG TPA: Stk1 family PASTA domain-containing Ser/Thr kinase [Solirubrobacterales bacterium]|nr:Stk1 family PASTA domain-containing Ser/Thr kinase [Solirubrobacterales bacterium]
MAENTLVDNRYRILRRLGAGGMAEVWCAEDTQLDRKVALKILQPRFAQDSEFVERFRREASSAAGLQHPNVVNVYDRGEFDGTYYIAMEYVEGASLRDLINQGMSVEAAVGVVRQILAAARFAHANGVIHRDLKPGNVLVDRNGRATVTDFGIAKAGPSEITQTGSVMGTAQYLSPEQAQGLEVTAASDLYSIGVVLYELLTGEVPFAADSAVAVALKQVSEMPRPPSELNPAVPRALDAVVMRALAKDPANRFASADEFEAALDAAEHDPSTAPFETAVYGIPPVAPPADAEAREGDGRLPPPAEQAPEEERRRRWRWVIVGLLLLGLAAMAVWALTRPAQVTVPSVIGTDVDAATATLEEEGLEVDVTEFSSDAKRGSVVEQDPRAGEEAEEGSTVVLSVSSGPGIAKVPRVEGLPEAEAADRLDRAGFRVDPKQRFSDELDPGVAIGTQPKQGTRLEQDSVVTLLVSKGSNLVEIPSVLGLDQDQAEAELERAGFIVNVDTEEADQAEGTVVAQDTGSLPRGSVVGITVSIGVAQVTVESVIGDSRQAARATLRAQGLKVTVRKQDVDTEDDDGIVLEQSPSGGTRVDPGSTVSIVVGRFRPSDAGFPEGE